MRDKARYRWRDREVLAKKVYSAALLSIVRAKKLSCFLRTWNKPALIYSPAKIEEVFDRPKLYSIKEVSVN